MKPVAAAVALVLLGTPLAAQRWGGPTGLVARHGVPRIVPVYPRGTFIDPGIAERKALVPMHIGPIPFPPEDRRWMRIETANFTIVSAVNEAFTRGVAYDIER